MPRTPSSPPIALNGALARAYRCLRITLICAFAAGAAAQPNPYRTISSWLEAPAGRELGSISAVDRDARGNLWIAERCGANDCSSNTDIAPILHADPSGKFLASFGA